MSGPRRYWLAHDCPECGLKDERYEHGGGSWGGARMGSSSWGHSFSCCSEACGQAFGAKHRELVKTEAGRSVLRQIWAKLQSQSDARLSGEPYPGYDAENQLRALGRSAAPSLSQRFADLRDKAGMPLDQARELALSEAGIASAADNQWFGDMMILQVLADSEHVNDQEREVLTRWMTASAPPGVPAVDAASICEQQAERWTDDRARYAANECAAAIRAAYGVMAADLPPLPDALVMVRDADPPGEDGGWIVDCDCEGPLSYSLEPGEALFTAEQMREYAIAARGVDAGADSAQNQRKNIPEIIPAPSSAPCPTCAENHYCPTHNPAPTTVISFSTTNLGPKNDHAAADCALAIDPLDTPLPCAVSVDGATFGKGVPLRTFVMAATHWRREAFGTPPSDEEKAANLARLQSCADGYPESELAEEIARFMAMSEEEVDAELRAMGIDPDEAARKGKRAVEGALLAIAKDRAAGGLDVAQPFTAKQKGVIAGDGEPCPNDHDPNCLWPECLCRDRNAGVDLARATEQKGAA